MHIICCKCGSTNVSCQAMINPNTKEFIHYTDESFDYGWCDDCRNGQVLTDSDEVQHQMDEAYKEHQSFYGEEPLYALCEIVYIGEDKSKEDVYFKLSLEIDDNDEKIFFYSKGLDELKSLAEYGQGDFIITRLEQFFNL